MENKRDTEHNLNVRMKASELDKLKDKAKLLGLDLSNYIRLIANAKTVSVET